MKMKFKILIFSLVLAISACASKKTNTIADGMSIETAIKVNDVSEEYAFVRERCLGCKMKGQSLISGKNGKKHYDLLTLIKPDGLEVHYYFDISSFYGKW